MNNCDLVYADQLGRKSAGLPLCKPNLSETEAIELAKIAEGGGTVFQDGVKIFPPSGSLFDCN